MAALKIRVCEGDPPDVRGGSCSEGGGARKRIKYTDEMKLILEESFQKSMFPSRETRMALAETTGISLEQVTVWFQNRRSGRNAAGVIAASLGAAAAKSKDYESSGGVAMREREMASKEDTLGRVEVKAELVSMEQLRERNGSASSSASASASASAAASAAAAAAAAAAYMKVSGSGGGSFISRGSAASGGGSGTEFLREGGKISVYNEHEQHHHHHHHAHHHSLPLPLPHMHSSYHSHLQNVVKHPDLLGSGAGPGTKDTLSRHGFVSSPASETMASGKTGRSSSPSYGGHSASLPPPSSSGGAIGGMLLSAKVEPENLFGSGPGTCAAFPPSRVHPTAAGAAASLARDTASTAAVLVGGKAAGQGVVTMSGGYQPIIRGRIVGPGLCTGDTWQQLATVGISGSDMFGASVAGGGASVPLLSATGRLNQGIAGSHRPVLAGAPNGSVGGVRLDVSGPRGAAPPSPHPRGSKGGSGSGSGSVMRGGGSSGGKHGDEGGGTQGKNPKFNRLRLTDAQKSILEAAFAVGAFPSREMRSELSQKTSMTMEQISTWFQNRRMRLKKPEAASAATAAAGASSQATSHKGAAMVGRSSGGIVPLTTRKHVPCSSPPPPPPPPPPLLNPNPSTHAVKHHSSNQVLNLNQPLGNVDRLAIVPASSSSPNRSDVCDVVRRLGFKDDDGEGGEAVAMATGGVVRSASAGERGGGSSLAAVTTHSVSSDLQQQQQHGMRDRPSPILRVHKTVVGHPAISPIPLWIPTLAQAQAAAAAAATAAGAEEAEALSSATAAAVIAAAQPTSNALEQVPCSLNARIGDADMGASAPSQHGMRHLLLPPPVGVSTTPTIVTVIAPPPPPPPSASSSYSALTALTLPSCPAAAAEAASIAAVRGCGASAAAAAAATEVEMVAGAMPKLPNMTAVAPSSSQDGTVPLFLAPLPVPSSTPSIDHSSLSGSGSGSGSALTLLLVPSPSEAVPPLEAANAVATSDIAMATSDIAMATSISGGLDGELAGLALSVAVPREECQIPAVEKIEANTPLPAYVSIGVSSPLKEGINPSSSPLPSTSPVAIERTLILSSPVIGIPATRATLAPVYSASLCSPSLPDLSSSLSHISKSVQQTPLSRMSMLEAESMTSGKDVTPHGAIIIPPVLPDSDPPSSLVDGSLTTSLDEKVENMPSIPDTQSLKNTLHKEEEEEEEEEEAPTIVVPSSCPLNTVRAIAASESSPGSPSVQEQDLTSPQTVEGAALTPPCVASPRGHLAISTSIEGDCFAEGETREALVKTPGQGTAAAPVEAGEGKERSRECSPPCRSLSPSVKLAGAEPRASSEPPSIVKRNESDGDDDHIGDASGNGDGDGDGMDIVRPGDDDVAERSDGGRRLMDMDDVMVAARSVKETCEGRETVGDPEADGGTNQKKREEEPAKTIEGGRGEKEEKGVTLNYLSALDRRADRERQVPTKCPGGEIRDAEAEEEEEEEKEKEEEEEEPSRQDLGDNILLASKEEELGIEGVEGEDPGKVDMVDEELD